MKLLPKLCPRSLLLACGIFLSVPIGAQLPSMGDEIDFPLRNERVIGDWIARNIYRDPDYIDDPILQEYVQNIWSGLMDASRKSGHLTPDLQERLAWRIFLDRDPSVNAYAMPGGYMGVNMGLIALVQSRSELAGVLAHEITHVTQRHIARSIGQQGRQTPLMLLAMLVGVAAIGRSPEAAQAAIVGSQAASAQSQLNFSRDMEREADRIGFSVMTRAGYQPEGMVEMFRKLDHANRLNDTGNYPYLRSHPLTGERISDMSNRMSQIGESHKPAPLVIDQMALLMAARAKVLSRPGVDALQVLSRHPESALFGQSSNAVQLAGLYAAVLASGQLRDESRTKDQLQRLKTLAQRTNALADAEVAQTFKLLELEVWMPTSGVNLPLLEKALSQSGLDQQIEQGTSLLSRPVLLLWAQAKIRLDQAQAVTQTLPAWISLHPNDSSAWRLQGAASEKLGLQSQSVRAEAEARVTELDYAGALERLLVAQTLASSTRADHFEQSILQSRIRAVRQLQSEQLDNEKALR